MTPVNLSAASGPKAPHTASPQPRPAPEAPVPSQPSPRETAGAMAPETLAASAPGPRFERRRSPAPEIPGVTGWVDRVNQDRRPPEAVVADLREARAHFAGLLGKGEQTSPHDGPRTNKLINPILNSENARNPGLNAVGCSHEDKMAGVLRALSGVGNGEEGHVRFHLGLVVDVHRIAVDAYRHRDGKFTLIAVDSSKQDITASKLAQLELKHPDIIKGTLVIPTPNQAHHEGCRIFAVNTLNALHDFQPYVQGLHKEVYAKGRGQPAPRLSQAAWKPMSGNTHVLASEKEAFGVLDGKFFKHMQVPKPRDGGTRNLLDEAEDRNPSLKTRALNKKDQTLRGRFAAQNPDRKPGEFSRADRTASLDRKRLVLIDRAIAHCEGLARE